MKPTGKEFQKIAEVRFIKNQVKAEILAWCEKNERVSDRGPFLYVRDIKDYIAREKK